MTTALILGSATSSDETLSKMLARSCGRTP